MKCLLLLLFIPIQTSDCHHITNTVAHYDSLRALVGNVTEIKGSDLTLVSKGKDQVAVRTFRLTSATSYYKKTETSIHRVEFAFLRDHQNGLWCVMYCYYCREVYAVTKLEGF